MYSISCIGILYHNYYKYSIKKIKTTTQIYSLFSPMNFLSVVILIPFIFYMNFIFSVLNLKQLFV